MPSKIFSFGFRHGLPVPGLLANASKVRPAYQKLGNSLIVDVRQILPKNPYHNKKLRKLRGDDEEVIFELESTPGIHQAYHELLGILRTYPEGTQFYIACTGGHHRSVYIANRLGADLNLPVEHLNYNDK